MLKYSKFKKPKPKGAGFFSFYIPSPYVINDTLDRSLSKDGLIKGVGILKTELG